MNVAQRLDHRVVVLSGPVHDLGYEIGLSLAGRGASVVIHERRPVPSNNSVALVGAINRQGSRAWLVSTTPDDAVHQMAPLADLLDDLGRIDAIVNHLPIAAASPAIGDPAGYPHVQRALRDDVHQIYALNQLLYRRMQVCGAGRIITVIPEYVLSGSSRCLAEATAGAAVLGLMNVLAQEGRTHQIAVNAVLARPDSRCLPSVIAELLSGPEKNGAILHASRTDVRTISRKVTRGWFSTGELPPTAGDIAERMESMGRQEGATEIGSLLEETDLMAREARTQRSARRPDPEHRRAVSLKDRVVVVTGAGHGLGRAYARHMAELGAKLVINDIGSEGGRSTARTVAREIVAAGGEAIDNSDDVTHPSGVGRLMDAAIDRYGRIDVLVNNAGIVSGKPFEEEPLEDLESLLAVHVEGAYLCTERAMTHMKEQGYGRVVNDSSSAGIFGLATRPAYGAAKAAMLGMTRAISVEGKPHGILANLVLPRAAVGRTPPASSNSSAMSPDLRARSVPEFVAPLVAYLSSERCESSGRVYTAFAGWYAEVLVGEAR